MSYTENTVECSVCGHEEEILQNPNKCENCKFFYTAKTDDGRIYRCHSEEFNRITKGGSVTPDFGCVFFFQ